MTRGLKRSRGILPDYLHSEATDLGTVRDGLAKTRVVPDLEAASQAAEDAQAQANEAIERLLSGELTVSEFSSIFDGVIQNSHIAGMGVGKLIAGSLAVGMDIVTGGTVKVGDGVSMDVQGLNLGKLAQSITDTLDNSTSPTYRVTSKGNTHRGSVNFVFQSGLNRHTTEVVQQSDGSPAAHVYIAARRSGTPDGANENATIRLIRAENGGDSQILFDTRFFQSNNDMEPHYESAYLQVGSGNTRTYNHNLGNKPARLLAYMSDVSAGTFPSPLPSPNVRISRVSDTELDVQNDANAARFVKVMAWHKSTLI